MRHQALAGRHVLRGLQQLRPQREGLDARQRQLQVDAGRLRRLAHTACAATRQDVVYESTAGPYYVLSNPA